MINRNVLKNTKWTIKTLGEVSVFLDHLRKPITKSDRIEGEYNYYGANGKQGTINDYIFDYPTILLAEDGGNFGNFDRTIAYKVDGKYWVNNHAHVIKPNEEIINFDFLLRVLEKYDVRPFINGATRQKLNKSDALLLEIPFPPLPEQQRIADILDKAEAINQKREQALALCDEFLRATFLNMFGDPVSNPKGWKVKKLSKFGEVITGSTPSRGKPEYYGNHIEWIKSDNINTPNNYITRAKEFLSVEGESVGRSVPENSILMTCIAGSLDCIGNIALTDRKVSFNQQVNGIVPNDDVDIYFLYSLLLYSKKYIQNHSTNSMKGMISKGKLSEIKFYLPEMAIQKEFSDIFLKIESVRNKIQSAQELPLFEALSQQAFKGELTQ